MALDTTPITEVDAFTAAVYPPKTGTTVSAADVLAGEQVFANRTKHLGNFYGCLGTASRAFDNDTGTITFWDTASFVDDATTPETFAGLKSGDLVMIDIVGVARLNRVAAGTSGDIRLKVTDQFGGAAPASFNPTGARIQLGNDTSGDPTAGVRVPFTISTTRTVTLDGDMKVILQGKVSTTGGGIDMEIVNTLTVKIVAFRQQKNPL